MTELRNLNKILMSSKLLTQTILNQQVYLSKKPWTPMLKKWRSWRGNMGLKSDIFGKCIFNLIISCHLVWRKAVSQNLFLKKPVRQAVFLQKPIFSPNWLHFFTPSNNIQDWLSGIKTVLDIRHLLFLDVVRKAESKSLQWDYGGSWSCLQNKIIAKLELQFCDIIRIKSIFIDSYKKGKHT